MRKVMLLLCLMVVFSWPSAAEPIPPGPVCPDPCTEYHCTPQGVCYCRPYPWPERCASLADSTSDVVSAGLPQVKATFVFMDVPSPDDAWMACRGQCQTGCCHSYPGEGNMCSIDWVCYDECMYNCTTTGGGGGGGW